MWYGRGAFSHQMSVEDPARLEEERRLCYVGITRAMQKLYLCYAEHRRFYGREVYHSPSRFIGEIPPELLQEVRVRNRTLVSQPAIIQSKQAYRDKSVPEYLRLGQQVQHAKFGLGTVLNCEGQGTQLRVQVKFNRAGVKWLMASVAKLEAVG